MRLWSPGRGVNRDLGWLEIPIVTDNDGRIYYEKHCPSTRPTSWMLQELVAHKLARNITSVSKHAKGDSGMWALLGDAIDRNITPIREKKPKYTNMLDRTVSGISAILTHKGGRLSKDNRSKGVDFIVAGT